MKGWNIQLLYSKVLILSKISYFLLFLNEYIKE